MLGQPIRIGQTVLYACYGSASLRLAAVVGLRETNERPELLVKTACGADTFLHYSKRTYVLTQPQPRKEKS